MENNTRRGGFSGGTQYVEKPKESKSINIEDISPPVAEAPIRQELEACAEIIAADDSKKFSKKKKDK